MSHLDEPQNWTTGSEPATDKQKAFLNTLASSHPDTDVDTGSLSKSEASAKIDELKNAPTSTSASTSNTSTSTTSSNNNDGNAASTTDGNEGTAVKGAQEEAANNRESLLANPSDWATGDDPATDKQKGYIAAMAKKAGEDVGSATQGGKIGKSDASEKIGELKEKTGM